MNRGIYDIAVLFDPTSAAVDGARAAGAVERQGRLHVRRVDRPAAAAIPHRAELGRRRGAVARLHGRRQQPDRFALQLEPRPDRRDADDDEGAHRRHATARSSTRWATAARAARSSRTRPRRSSPGCSTASSRAATTRTRSPPASRSSDCVLLVNFYAGPEWTALMTGLTQAQINAKKTAINGHLDQIGCQSWNNAFGFNNKPGNYVPTLVDQPDDRRDRADRRAAQQLPAAGRAGLRPGDQSERHALRRRRPRRRGLGHRPPASPRAARARGRPATTSASSTG